MRGKRWGVLVALGALLLAGCTAAPPPAAAPRPTADAPSPPAPSPSPTGTPLTVAALGDSLSRGFDACAAFGDCPEASWATGTDPRVDSVADRLGALRDATITRVDAARSGADSSDLARQVETVIPHSPDLVTMLMGANDVCRPDLTEMTPAPVYTERIDAALDRLAAALPDATVLVASVPDVTALLPVAGGDPTARFIWSRLNGCSTVLEAPQSTSAAAELRRDEVRARVAEYDDALRAACAAHPRCVYDDGALRAYRPELAQLSALDYFHPSIAGQAELAALEWRALTSSALVP
ncbi:GDSL-type esterase/lipase family protein [Amnibacterium endophyticum]|uniref:GDSL-type esterase/lipase family protein n=1 Tax=Amnibacterium endophyticum TaxID=2109337 RepID=A0ABW4LA87_9MICO